MNPFEQMSKSLSSRQPNKSPAQPGAKSKPQSRVGTIRDLLKSEARPMTAAEIAYDVDLPSFDQNLVWLLLKHDIAKGRVLFSGGTFAWSAEFDLAESAAIRAAIKLLKKNGYTVTKATA